MKIRTVLLLSAVLAGPVHLASYIPACPTTHPTVDFMPVVGTSLATRSTQAPVTVYLAGQAPPPGFRRAGRLTVYGKRPDATYLSLLAIAKQQACLHGGDALIGADSTRVDNRPQLVADVVRYSR